MEGIHIPPWFWKFLTVVVLPLIFLVWKEMQNRIRRQDDLIQTQQKRIHALDLCLSDYVKTAKFDKEIDTLHKINAAMNNNFRADIKEVRAAVQHANDRIDTKADKA